MSIATLRCTACRSSAHGVAPLLLRELAREVRGVERGVGPPGFTEELLDAGGRRDPLSERPLALGVRRGERSRPPRRLRSPFLSGESESSRLPDSLPISMPGGAMANDADDGRESDPIGGSIVSFFSFACGSFSNSCSRCGAMINLKLSSADDISMTDDVTLNEWSDT